VSRQQRRQVAVRKQFLDLDLYPNGIDVFEEKHTAGGQQLVKPAECPTPVRLGGAAQAVAAVDDIERACP
jgi:hypothetical protein